MSTSRVRHFRSATAVGLGITFLLAAVGCGGNSPAERPTPAISLTVSDDMSPCRIMLDSRADMLTGPVTAQFTVKEDSQLTGGNCTLKVSGRTLVTLTTYVGSTSTTAQDRFNQLMGIGRNPSQDHSRHTYVPDGTEERVLNSPTNSSPNGDYNAVGVHLGRYIVTVTVAVPQTRGQLLSVADAALGSVTPAKG